MEQTKDIVEQLSVDLNLEEMIILTQSLLNDMIAQEGFDCSSIFNSNSKPSIRIDAFLRRIHKYTHFSPQCLIFAIIYIDRYNMANEQFNLNWLNVHKILLSSLLLGVKFHDDLYYDNKAFELAGGVNTAQLMKFQLQIFSMMDFNAFVQQQEYEALLRKLYDVYAD